jgi:hypothetical protein
MSLAEILGLLSAILGNTTALLSGVIGVAFTLWCVLLRPSSPARTPLIVAAIAALLLSPILAWRDEHRKLSEVTNALNSLRKSARYGIEITRIDFLADGSPDEPLTIQLQIFLRNNRPQDALHYVVETEVMTVAGTNIRGSGLPGDWHGIGPNSEQSYRGQRFANVRFTAPRVEAVVDYCIRYGISGDSVTYRMKRQIVLLFTKDSDVMPQLQSWTVLSETDVLTP